ncbi:hypothetical protein [Streptomyces qaidamensis]|uniref:hypothetical protein n=1 Tax=Streptomyces qaidamensis TaxID=1783515 RepID=UPI000AEC9963|nr:hypothetical protein [Streptomyces qaidamensis]
MQRTTLTPQEWGIWGRLPEAAAALVAVWEGKPLPERMERALRRTPRRFTWKTNGLTYEPGAAGERQLARR